MVETWKVQTEFSDGQETNRRGFIFRGVLGLKNDSLDTVEVREIFIEPRYGSVQAGFGAGATSVHRISAMSGGESVVAEKHSSASADLPAQVSVVTNPDSIVRADVFRRQGDLPGVLVRAGASSLGAVKNQNIGDPWNHVIGFRRARPAGSVQKIILREGEGVAWTQVNITSASQKWAAIGITNQASGASYTAFTSRATPRDNEASLIAVMNGSGSGVILEVDVIEAINPGAIGLSSIWNFPVGLRVMFAHELNEGESISPVPHSTANAAIPAGVVCLRDPEVVVAYVPTQYPFDAMEAPTLSTNIAAGPAMTHQLDGFIRGAQQDTRAISGSGAPGPFQLQNRRRILGGAGPAKGDIASIMVRPKQRLAVAWGFSSNFFRNLTVPVNDWWFGAETNYDVSMEFNIVTAPPVASGGVSKNRIIGAV